MVASNEMTIVQNKLTARVFIGAVSAVFLSITEKTSLDTVWVSAGQEAILAQRLLCV